MVWDNRVALMDEVVKELKKKTPKFPSRERNFAIRRRISTRTCSPLICELAPENQTSSTDSCNNFYPQVL